MPSSQYNPKGYFENQKITLYNDSILLPFLKSSYDDIRYLNIEKKLPYLSQKISDNALKIIEEEYQNSNIFGIKDPRMCILMPFWEKILKDLNIEINYILIYRNSLEVAHSLKKRDNFNLEKGLLLWAKYVLFAEYYSRNYKRIFISYEELLKNPVKAVKKIDKNLNIFDQIPIEYSISSINRFLDNSLKHHNFQHFQLSDSYAILSEFIIKINKLYNSIIDYETLRLNQKMIDEFNLLRKVYKNYTRKIYYLRPRMFLNIFRKGDLIEQLIN